jgi:hypothetical protein
MEHYHQKTNPLLDNFKTLTTGDYIEVTLSTKLAMLYSPGQGRFDADDMSTKKIRGVVYSCILHPEFKCYVLEIVTAKLLNGPVKRSYTILQDEIESITKLTPGTVNDDKCFYRSLEKWFSAITQHVRKFFTELFTG